MEKKTKKDTFPLPTEANQKGEMSIRSNANPLNPEMKPSGGSVDEHREIEGANEYIAKKEISQAFNNS